MPKYIVSVRYFCEYEEEISVNAPDEDIAIERAEKIVSKWKNVTEADAESVERA